MNLLIQSIGLNQAFRRKEEKRGIVNKMNPTSEQINHIGRSIQVDTKVVKSLDELGLSRETVAAFYGMSLELFDSIFHQDEFLYEDGYPVPLD